METSQQQALPERPEYPKFYRKGNLCLKRESHTTTTEILVPDEKKDLPLSHQHVTYPTKERLNEAISTMGLVTSEIYEDYLSTFFIGAARNREKFTEYRQRKYEQKLKPPDPPPDREIRVISPTTPPPPAKKNISL